MAGGRRTPSRGRARCWSTVAATRGQPGRPAAAPGHYDPPPGASPYPGLECSGRITGAGRRASSGWSVGDEVCALLSGGGYAEQVAVPGRAAAAGAGRRRPGRRRRAARGRLHRVVERLHARGAAAGRDAAGARRQRRASARWRSSSAERIGARVAVTAGSAEKLERCRELGAEILVNYRERGLRRGGAGGDRRARRRRGARQHGCEVPGPQPRRARRQRPARR